MNIIRVIPLSRGIFKGELSYFSGQDIPAGTLVTVPVRRRSVPALVISCEDASLHKAQLRSSSYQIKKIESSSGKKFFSPEFIAAAKRAADYFAANPGEIISALVPKTILTEKVRAGKKQKKAVEESRDGFAAPDQFVFQSDDDDRLSTYKSLIREDFARNKSIFFCLPTIQDIERVVAKLERGIKEYTFVLHSGLTKKQLLETWEKIVTESHPVLVVATGTFLSLPRKDIHTLIVDKENSPSYRTLSRPFIDIRTFTEIFAREAKLRLIFGDIFLRPETLWRYKEKGEFLELMPPKFRLLSTADQKLVDMTEEKGVVHKKEFSLLSPELKDLITRAKDDNDNLLILVSRKGLHPITICGDCSTPVLCPKCHSPFVLHTRPGRATNFFLCHKCGMQERPDMKCSVCKSWRLVPLGIGTESAAREIEKFFPKTKIFIMDSEHVTTHKKALALSKQFFSSPGSVLIGTEMALHYLADKVDRSAVISLDSLFAIPDFRIGEKVFTTLLTLRSRTQKELLVQTRNPTQPVFEHALHGNLIDFYRQEIADRKEFEYPPFKRLIKITCRGKKEVVDKEVGKLEKLLEKHEPTVYPSFTEQARGIYHKNILLRLDRDAWPDEKLLGLLRGLPPFFSVKVDPGDLL